MILLTGATGFIGKHILQIGMECGVLRYDNTLIVGRMSPPGYRHLSVSDYTVGACEQLIDLSDIDTVLHLGSFIPKSVFEADERNGAVSNVTFTAALLNALDRSSQHPKRILYASTIDVYTSNAERIDESTPCQPTSLYGWSKLFCEQMISRWAITNGNDAVILRIGHIYGPGEDAYRKLIPESIRRLLSGQTPRIIGEGHARRSFLHVADCCRMILKALQVETLPEGPINIVSGHAVSVLELVTMIIELTGSNLSPQYVPTQVSERDLLFNPERMHRFLGRPQKGLREGLAEEIDHFRSLNL